MNRMAKVVVWCLLVLFSVSVVGCHTIRGAGQDVEGAGEAVQRATE
jgi:predicted small secreted protein